MTNGALARKRNFLIAMFLLGMTGCNLVLVSRVLTPLRNGLQDFTIYYMAAGLVREGRAAALYDTDVQYKSQLAFARVDRPEAIEPFNHPAFEAILFIPLTFLSYWPAYLVWTLLSLIMLTICALLLQHLPEIRDLPLLLLALGSLAFFPVVMGILMGQDTVLFLLMFVLALTCLYRGADVASGAWLAAALFRPHLVLPLVLLIAARRWRVLLGFVPVALVLVGISVAILGWGGPRAYIQFVLQAERPHNGIGPHDLSTLWGLSSVLLGVKHSLLAGMLTAVSSFAVFGLALRRIRNGCDSIGYSFCLASVASLLVSFHAFSYDSTLLLPLVLFMLASAANAGSPQCDAEGLLALFVLFLTPMYVYLVMKIRLFSLFSLVLLWLYSRLLRTPAPAAEPV